MAGHTTNQRAFRDCDVNEPFFRLYTLMVAIELALKDQLPTFVHGHDLAKLIPQVIQQISSNLQSQLTTFDKSLKNLWCTYKGSRAQVNPAQYPDLRYLRHAKDGFVGDSEDIDIHQALWDAEQLIKELKQAGVKL